MATLRQYFETDFSNSVRVHVRFRYLEEDIQGVLLYELSAFTAFLREKGLPIKGQVKRLLDEGAAEILKDIYGQ